MVIGASNDRSKFGNKSVRAHLRQGHDVFPVNLHEKTIEGLRVWRCVGDVPGPIDRALFYVQPEIGITLIGKLASRGDVGEMWLNPGAESDELIAEARAMGIEPVLACAIVAVGERP